MDSSLHQLFTPIVNLCLAEGVGFNQAKEVLKLAFAEQARLELRRRGERVTASAMHVLSGLNHVALREMGDLGSRFKPTAVEQVMLMWVSAGYPKTLAYKGAGRTFMSLIDACEMTNVSARVILREMQQRGLVSKKGLQITRLKEVGSDSCGDRAVREYLIGAVSDHAQVAVDNLYKRNPNRLEQSLFGDALSEGSVEEIHALARVWWSKGVKSIGNELARLDVLDASLPKSDLYRMRLGIYFYSEPLSGVTDVASDSVDGAVSSPSVFNN